ncbi:hypothetical protein [Ruegeria atlantica]|uniref:hypothetical protein n=1 Tax=Ruegeria atlantica TaxID=81569 RepID=UPI00148080BD|nr:hypothetical protein [Ruegeria atlantica]
MLKILALSLPLLGGSALADVQSCKKLFDLAPKVLSDLKQVGSHEYENENPGLGYSVTFADPSSKLTVFFYDHQEKNISPEMALDSFKQAARDIAAVAEKRGAELGEINAYQMRDTPQVLPLRAEAESTDGISELLALGVVDDCIVKLRFTAHFPLDKAQVWVKVITDYLNKGFRQPT